MKMEAVGLKGVLVLRLAGCDNGVWWKEMVACDAAGVWFAFIAKGEIITNEEASEVTMMNLQSCGRPGRDGLKMWGIWWFLRGSCIRSTACLPTNLRKWSSRKANAMASLARFLLEQRWRRITYVLMNEIYRGYIPLTKHLQSSWIIPVPLFCLIVVFVGFLCDFPIRIFFGLQNKRLVEVDFPQKLVYHLWDLWELNKMYIFFVHIDTVPETNIAPGNWWLEDYLLSFWDLFLGCNSFRQGGNTFYICVFFLDVFFSYLNIYTHIKKGKPE